MSKSIQKGFQLLELVAAGHATLTDISRESELAKSTAHRLLSELVRQGALVRTNRRYSLGVRLMVLGEHARRELAFTEVAHPRMQALSERTHETVHLGVLDGTDIVYVAKVNGERGLQMASYVGLRSPAQTTAMGKVLLASLPRTEWASRYRELAPRTDHTIARFDAFEEELEAVRRSGYALDREENEIGIRCVAAPVTDSDGTALAAVSISGASIYISQERLLTLVPEVQACANQISVALGAEPPRQNRHPTVAETSEQPGRDRA